MNLNALLVTAFIVSVMFALPSSARADPPAIKEIRRFAEDVVIGSKPSARLVKWRRTPTIRLETLQTGPRDAVTGKAVPIPIKTSLTHYLALKKNITELSSLSGMSMRLMPRDIGSGGDIVMTIVPRTLMSVVPFPGVPEKTLAQLRGPGRCFFVIWPTRNWAIQKAKIIINSLLDGNHIKHCLLEELTQSLGLPNDSDRLRPSVFNESAMLTELSYLDRILIRSVYDPRITQGMSLGAFREKADAVIGSYIFAD